MGRRGRALPAFPPTSTPRAWTFKAGSRMGISPEFAERQFAVVDASTAFGATPACSCTPYAHRTATGVRRESRLERVERRQLRQLRPRRTHEPGGRPQRPGCGPHGTHSPLWPAFGRESSRGCPGRSALPSRHGSRLWGPRLPRWPPDRTVGALFSRPHAPAVRPEGSARGRRQPARAGRGHGFRRRRRSVPHRGRDSRSARAERTANRASPRHHRQLGGGLRCSQHDAPGRHRSGQCRLPTRLRRRDHGNRGAGARPQPEDTPVGHYCAPDRRPRCRGQLPTSKRRAGS